MWSPVYDVSSILTSIQSLLNDPNVNSPANNTAAVMYSQNYQEYVSRVKQIVEASQENVEGEEEDDDGDGDDGSNSGAAEEEVKCDEEAGANERSVAVS